MRRSCQLEGAQQARARSPLCHRCSPCLAWHAARLVVPSSHMEAVKQSSALLLRGSSPQDNPWCCEKHPGCYPVLLGFCLGQGCISGPGAVQARRGSQRHPPAVGHHQTITLMGSSPLALPDKPRPQSRGNSSQAGGRLHPSLSWVRSQTSPS